MRVLYSFPHKLGADRICKTAWQQVNGLAAAGAQVTVFTGALHKPVRPEVAVRTTLSRGKLRIPYKVLGTQRACALHDALVARKLVEAREQIDIVHAWPLGALRTLQTAARLGIPAVLERCNAHTAFAYQVVRDECARLGITLPPNYEHAYNEKALRRELEEYEAAYRLLCPSEFVVKSFIERSFPRQKLVRHIYGFDEKEFYPAAHRPDSSSGLTVLFVGFCAVRKGLHFALEAWLKSPAHKNGTFLIAGEFMPAYAERLKELLAHPSVRVLGHRNDVPELMRHSDILVLPSLEEGFGLVCVEAMGSGCVPVVSNACTDVCQHLRNALVHPAGDVETLRRHFSMLERDRPLLRTLRNAALETAPQVTWAAAGAKLLQVYHTTVESMQHPHSATA